MAVTDGDDRRVRLVRLRDQLAAAIEVAEPNMLPQLAGQYRATLADLAGLPAAVEEKSERDDLKTRRAARVAAAAAGAPVKRGGKKLGT